MTGHRNAETARLLAEAADLIETRGWYQGDYCDHATGRLCVGGAIRLATAGTLDEHDDATVEAADAAEETFGQWLVMRECGDASGFNYYAYIYGWNDHSSRTQAEVIDVLHEAADDIGKNVRGVA